MRVAVLLLALLALACATRDIDVVGKPCPCPTGFTCDEPCKLCRRESSPQGAACGCKIQITQFKADWATPNAIRWVWEPNGNADDFQSYELVLTDDATGAQFSYGPLQNPELALFALPNASSDLVRSTITSGLAAGVIYGGELAVTDRDGCVSRAENTAPQTTVPFSEAPIELFGASPFTGFVQGGELTSSGCQSGSQCILSFPCTNPTTGRCKDNLKISGLNVGAGNLQEGAFEQAYLEFWAKNESEAPSHYSYAWLALPPDSNKRIFRSPEFTVRATGEYERIQIPLREMGDAEAHLDYAGLRDEHVIEFAYYNSFSQDKHFGFDEVFIRW